MKAEIFVDLAALANRAQNPLSVSQALFQGQSAKAAPTGDSQPVVLNFLVSLAYDARISSLLRKVEYDYRSKTQQAIKCK